MKNILVLGAGAWGTALALQLAYAGNNVKINSWKLEHNQEMIRNSNNIKYVSNIKKFPDNLNIIIDWKSNINEFDDILIATPSSGFINILNEIKTVCNSNQGIISATKGFCHNTYKLLSTLAKEILPQNEFSIITGPSFAKEVANKLPTAVVVSSNNINFATYVQKLFNTESFRCYTSNDIIGSQIGGAVKNVIAIAAGVSAGMNYGVNAHAALITRGLKELTRLGLKLGAKENTFMGLSCLGDLLLTCSDNQSRNRRFGLYLGQGNNIQESLKLVGNVVEGYFTTKAVYELAKINNIEMPIVNATYELLYNNKCPKFLIKELMVRELKAE